VALRDKRPPPGADGSVGGAVGRKGLRRLRLHVRRLGRRRARVRVLGGGTRLICRADFLRGKTRLARDRKRPFRKVVRIGPRRTKLRARILLLDGRRVVRTKRIHRANERSQTP
jgi:hypothetical protein